MKYYIDESNYLNTGNFEEDYSYDLFDELDDFYEPKYDEEMY